MLRSRNAVRRANQARQFCAKATEELGIVQLDADCPQEVLEIAQFLKISEEKLARVVADAWV